MSKPLVEVKGLVRWFEKVRAVNGVSFDLPAGQVVGLIGAMLGGFLFGLAVPGDAGFWGSILVAFIGACIFIVVVRFIALNRTRL